MVANRVAGWLDDVDIATTDTFNADLDFRRQWSDERIISFERYTNPYPQSLMISWLEFRWKAYKFLSDIIDRPNMNLSWESFCFPVPDFYFYLFILPKRRLFQLFHAFNKTNSLDGAFDKLSGFSSKNLKSAFSLFHGRWLARVFISVWSK